MNEEKLRLHCTPRCSRHVVRRGPQAVPIRRFRLVTLLLTCACSHAVAEGPRYTKTPREVARIVSKAPENQRLIDAIQIDETFERLSIPILIGSSVIPALSIVESIVHDEVVHEIDPRWAEAWDNEDEAGRLLKLDIDPYHPGASMDSLEVSPHIDLSATNLVRTVVWPSGHVLWLVEGGNLPGSLRNSKGMIVEYRFGRLDFGKMIKQIEERIFPKKPLPGYYRKSVLFEHHVLYMSAEIHDLVIVDRKYIFKFLSQVAEEQDDPFFEKWEFFYTDDPKKDAKQFVDVLAAVRKALPTSHYATLTSEPKYVWKGDTDPREENQSPSPGQQAKTEPPKAGSRETEPQH